MTNEREPLWSDDRIEAELRRIGDNMRLYIADAATVAEQVRDEYEARIAELEQQVANKEELIVQLVEIDMPAMEDANERLEARLAQTWQPLPDGEVFDTITRSLVSSESINDTHTWMRRVDAATKWINALRGKE